MKQEGIAPISEGAVDDPVAEELALILMTSAMHLASLLYVRQGWRKVAWLEDCRF